jgi:MoxR-like ATPase
MEERQITVDGQTYPLAAPYFVIATQNPVETQGTYPLPEAQLDRFLVRLCLGYPTAEETVGIIKRHMPGSPLSEIKPVCKAADLLEMQKTAKSVFIHDELLGYIVELTEKTRTDASVILGVSTRGAIALSSLCQAYAALSGREYVHPDDVQKLIPYAYAHRIIHRGGSAGSVEGLLKDIVADTKVPSEDYRGKS